MKRLIILSAFGVSLLASCGAPMSSQSLGPVAAQPLAPEITLQKDFYASGDSLHLLLKFEDVRRALNVQEAGRILYYSVRAGDAEQDAQLLRDSVSLEQFREKKTDGLLVPLPLAKELVKKPNVLHLQLWAGLAGSERIGAKYRVPLQEDMLQKRFMLLHAKNKLPLYEGYATTSEPFLFQDFAAGPDSLASDSLKVELRVQRFANEFAPALPPISVRPEPAPRTLTALEENRYLPSDTIRFTTPGLYLYAPSSAFARGVLIEPNNFPLVTMATELVDPLIYLTTSAEREGLKQAPDPKAAVDRFWLKIAGDKNTARELIRTYYSRVETANRLYTSHKAGWASDRGMIYIIYGQPSNVSRSGNTESWIYRRSETSPYVKFVFIKKENNFTGNHYELIRRPEYEESWYGTVAKWRAGITDM